MKSFDVFIADEYTTVVRSTYDPSVTSPPSDATVSSDASVTGTSFYAVFRECPKRFMLNYDGLFCNGFAYEMQSISHTFV